MMRFEHIGYAVENIDAYVRGFLKPVLRPVRVGATQEDPIQRVRIAFAELEGGVMLELIEPMGPSSPVSVLLKRRRGGLAHLCFAVSDLNAELIAMRAYGCKVFAEPAPATALAGRRSAFLMTPQFDVIELAEEQTRNNEDHR